MAKINVGFNWLLPPDGADLGKSIFLWIFITIFQGINIMTSTLKISLIYIFFLNWKICIPKIWFPLITAENFRIGLYISSKTVIFNLIVSKTRIIYSQVNVYMSKSFQNFDIIFKEKSLLFWKNNVINALPAHFCANIFKINFYFQKMYYFNCS